MPYRIYLFGFTRLVTAAGKHGHSTTEFSGSRALLCVLCPRSLDTQGNALHLVLAVELHLLQLDFFQEVFGTEVGCRGDSLQFCFVFRVLLGQTLILGVCIEEYVPRCPLRCCHASSSRLRGLNCEDYMNER